MTYDQRYSKLGPETRAIIAALEKTLDPGYPEVYQEGLWIFRKFGKRYYRIFPLDGYIAMDGADVVTDLSINWAHRIIRFYMFQTDAAYAADPDSLDIDIERQAGTTEPLAQFAEPLSREDNLPGDEIHEIFGMSFEFEASTWRITLNGTNTNLVFPNFIVERLEI